MKVLDKDSTSFIDTLMQDSDFTSSCDLKGAPENPFKISAPGAEKAASLTHAWELRENTKQFISHYGVLGMKWGVRKDRRKSRAKTAGSNRSLSDLSDNELQQRITRIEREQRLSTLLNPPRKPNAGSEMVKIALKQSGTQLLTTAMTGVGTYALNKTISKIADPALADLMTKKKK